MDLEGGCFCGNIRYRVSGKPVIQLMCYCRDCLSLSGTDGFAGMMFKERDFQIVRGSPTTFEKISKENRPVVRHFCGTCGTGLWGTTSFGLVSIHAGTLDDPSVFNPDRNVFVDDAPHWARIAELADPNSSN